MAENDVDDTSSPSSHPFFGRGGFPFVFLPTTLAGGFNFTNNHTHVSSVNDHSTTEPKKKQENGENNDDGEEEEERTETIDDDEGDRKDENDESVDEKSNVRISQPKYSQLLKGLDFSQARMVDVTNLLPNELDQQENQSVHDETENDTQKRTTDDEKYQSLSSARSSISDDEASNPRTFNNNETDENKIKEDDRLTNAVHDIENDLNNLATIINQASTDKNEEEEEENDHDKNDLQKKSTFDEEDDTSRQATQDYDLHENEPENLVTSTKSNRIHHIIHQHTFDLQNENQSLISPLDTNTHIETQNQTTKQGENEGKHQQSSIDWESLIYGTEPIVQPPGARTSSQPMTGSHSTPNKSQQQTFVSSEDKSRAGTSAFTAQKVTPRTRPIISSSSSSSDTDSIVEYALHRSKEKQPSSCLPKHIPLVNPPQTLRQDSQATLIDENLDELSSQVKQVLVGRERQTGHTSTKEERATNRTGTASFRLSTPDLLSTTVLDDDILNRPNDNLLRHISNQRINYNQQRNRHSSHAPERSSSHRKKSHHHHHHHQKYPTSRPIDRAEEINPQNVDADWLTMLEKLEREHKTRIEQQRKQYEDYMHSLENKMKRRFDDYLTLTNGSQESRSDDYDNIVHAHRTHTSLPKDSNFEKYKGHSYNHTYRPLAADLVSHYYPADSTLNVLTADKKRATMTDNITPSQSTEDIVNLRTQISARHVKHTDDVKSRHDYEINDLKSQLNRTRLGHTSGTARQSMATIERINNENVRLRDEVTGLRHSSKVFEDENISLKRQLDDLREQINHKDLVLKNYHRTTADLERKLNDAENKKERQNEKLRHTDRQASLYREENEKIKVDLNRTRFHQWPEWERLLRLEERSREQENENETLRRQLFLSENDSNRMRNRLTDDHKLNSAMPLNLSSPTEYQHFNLTTAARHSSSTISTPRDGIIDSGRFQSNDTGSSFHHAHSSRPLTRMNDYLTDKSLASQLYVSPSRNVYSPKKTSPTRRRTESIPRGGSFDRSTKQTEQLEQKFDQLLKKKRDLETRLNRIPLRGLTNTDQQLYDVLEREIERVDQQIMSVKLDLRKSTTFHAH